MITTGNSTYVPQKMARHPSYSTPRARWNGKIAGNYVPKVTKYRGLQPYSSKIEIPSEFSEKEEAWWCTTILNVP